MRERGFTLIELMVVVGIMGMLAAIAVPQFMSYRKKAFDATVKSDLRNAVIHEEGYAALDGNYTDQIDKLKERGFQFSKDVEFLSLKADNYFWSLSARHKSCAPNTGVWTYSNQTGQFDGIDCQ